MPNIRKPHETWRLMIWGGDLNTNRSGVVVKTAFQGNDKTEISALFVNNYIRECSNGEDETHYYEVMSPSDMCKSFPKRFKQFPSELL